MTVLVATVNGLHEIGPAGGRVHLEGRDVTAVDSLGWALVDGQEVVHCEHETWESYGRLTDDLDATCLLVSDHGLFLGLAGGHLVAMHDDGFELLASFEDAPGRTEWYTPWGGPPDTRSLAEDDGGALFANIHVGGILRSTDRGSTWEPTVDLHVDVHEVLAVDGTSRIVAATGTGLAESADGGRSWTMDVEGLETTYLRAVAVTGDTLLVSASEGPGGGRSALYRRQLENGAANGEPFEKVDGGLPTWFTDNVDTGWLAAKGDRVAVATPDGSVYRSQDRGCSFEQVARSLPSPHWVSLSAE